MFFACKNDLKEINAFSSMLDTLPHISAKDIKFTYSEYGEPQVILSGPLMNNYDGDDPYMEFPDGFLVEFYDDSTKLVKTTLRANYGINYQDKKIMIAKGNVIVNNFETKEILNTEELIWDQNTKLIYSNKFVKVTSDDGVLYGDGLESDQTFSKRRIINPTGEILVEDDAPNNN